MNEENNQHEEVAQAAEFFRDNDMPKWITPPEGKDENGEYIWKVDCFGEIYEIKELVGSQYQAAEEFATRTKRDPSLVTLQRSVKGIRPDELDKLRGRVYMRLKTALTYVYGLNDF